MAALSVEHLKVMAASRACFRIQLTYLVGGLWSSASGPYGRAPKGDGGQSSLLSHSIDLFGGGGYGRAPPDLISRAP